MSDLTFFLVRVGVLALLWIFILAALRTIRTDVFGPKVPRAARAQAAPPPRAAKPKPQKPGKLPRHLVVTPPAGGGLTIDLADAPVTIGRDAGSTVVLTDDYASTHHARLVPRDGQWILEDLGSTNGTYLDRAKVSAPTPLRAGDKVRIGKTVLELRR